MKKASHKIVYDSIYVICLEYTNLQRQKDVLMVCDIESVEEMENGAAFLFAVKVFKFLMVTVKQL
jgi:hypothetical protein